VYRFLKVLRSRPLESLVGLALLVIGGYAAGASKDATVRTWGAILAGLGGVLLSWTTGTAYSREQALEEIDNRLLSLSRQLGTETSNISLSVEQAQRGSISPETCFSLLSQSLNSLTNIVAEIQTQLGDEFNPQGLIATREKIAELTSTISSHEVPTKAELELIREQLTDISADLRRASRASPSVTRHAPRVPSPQLVTAPQLVTESVTCPVCSTPQRVDLGNQSGATASIKCDNCRSSFNAHRASDGAVFTRLIDEQRNKPVVFKCVSCDNDVSLRVQSNSGSPHRAVCLNCGASLVVDVHSLSAEVDAQFKFVDADIKGAYNSRPLLDCPSCSKRLTAIIRQPDYYYAICAQDKLLLRTPAKPFQAYWKSHRANADGDGRDAGAE
jgi:transcription elongation factor Elf1